MKKNVRFILLILLFCPALAEDEKPGPDTAKFWIFLSVSLILVAISGLMSGLTVGYQSIDELQLDLKAKTGTEEDKKNAAIIKPLLAKNHLRQATLVTANSFAVGALPIFFDSIVPAVAAIIISATALVIFGEIVPQALCTGPKQIAIARKFAPLVNFLMILLYPICKPISKALAHFIGDRARLKMQRTDLKALIELHEQPALQVVVHQPEEEKSASSKVEESPLKSVKLTQDEIKVINSTIDLSETPVTKEMKPIDQVFMVDECTVITEERIDEFVKSGFSKIPVCRNFNKNNVVGFLKVKSLANISKTCLNTKTIKDSGIPLLKPHIVPENTSMLEMLMRFQREKTAIALISNEQKDEGGVSALPEGKEFALVGLVSLKDIFEEILESKLHDDDVHILVHSNLRPPTNNKPIVLEPAVSVG